MGRRTQSQIFEDTYKPREFPDTITGHPQLLETYGKELEMVQKLNIENHKQVWTLVDGNDGKTYVVAGYHFVNRLNYIITEVPWETGDEQFLW